MARRRLEHLLKTFDEAEKVLRSSKSVAETSHSFLKILAEGLSCKWGTYWEVDSKDRVLRPAYMWSAPGVVAKKLEMDTRERTLSVHEGTAGHVWASRKPVWTTDIFRDMCIPRSLDAMAAGLPGGVWFPLKTDSAVYAVIELLGDDLPTASGEVLFGLENFGYRLGKLVEAIYYQK